MKCRALSETNNIVWFGKTGEQNEFWINIPKFGIKGYSSDLEAGETNILFYPKSSRFSTFAGKTFDDIAGLRFCDIIDSFVLNGDRYYMIFDEGSAINGKIYAEISGSLGSPIGEFAYTNKPVKNYSEGAEGVADSLTQRLSVIKGELWYQVNFGLPLLNNYVSPTIFDMVIQDIIVSHPGVVGLTGFTSRKNGHTYTFSGVIQTVFGEDISISNSYSV